MLLEAMELGVDMFQLNDTELMQVRFIKFNPGTVRAMTTNVTQANLTFYS